MSLGAYLEGVALVGSMVLSFLVAAVLLRRRLLPAAAPAVARLAEALLALALLIGVAQVLGIVGLLEVWSLVIGSLLTCAATALLARGEDRPPIAAPRAGVLGLVALLACGPLAVQWLGATVETLDRGMVNVDSLWYHLPFAAEFAQSGSITSPLWTQSDPLSLFPPEYAQRSLGLPAFYPANSSLMHAVGLVLFGSDTLSALVNIGFMGLALLAGWCIGLPSRTSAATLLASALALALPIMTATQAGEATNDVAVLALLLVAAALLVNGAGQRSAIVLAGIAAGLAVGTKLTAVAPVAALTLGVLWASRDRRMRAPAGLWLAALPAAGGFWYLRNLLDTGSPLPLVDLPAPFEALDVRSLRLGNQTVLDYATDFDVWRSYFFPGLDTSFGTFWPVVLAAGLAGALVTLFRPASNWHRVVAVAALVGSAAYLVTPQSAAGFEGRPEVFQFNLRFLVPSLGLGLVLLPTLPPLASGGRRVAVTAGLAILVLGTSVDASAWPESRSKTVLAVALVAGLAFAAVAVAAARPRLPRRALVPALAACVVLATALGRPVHEHYLQVRYGEAPTGWGLDMAYRWARSVEHARIGIEGFVLRHPLYGTEITNSVEYIGREDDEGVLRPLASCREWRQAIDDSRYDYVVTTPPDSPFGPSDRPPVEATWTRTAAAASEIVRGAGHVSVFRIDGSMRAGTCD